MVAEAPVIKEAIPKRAEQGHCHIFSEDEYKRLGFYEVPYITRMSFFPLIKWWRDRLKSGNIAERTLAKAIIAKVEEAPELLEPIEDFSDLEAHRDVVDLLMAGLFPLSRQDDHLGKVSAPFQMKEFYMTPGMDKLINEFNVRYKIEGSVHMIQSAMVIRACAIILNKVYGQNIKVDPNLILTLQCPCSHMEQHYKTVLHLDYMEVKYKKKPKKLTEAQINRLLSNIHDLKAWTEAIPPENFEIHGIVGAEFVNISDREIISRFKNELLEQNAVLKPENIKRMELMFQSYFQNSELRMGLTAIDYPPEKAVPHKYAIRYDFLADKYEKLLIPETVNSIYDKVCRYKEIMLIEDLEKPTFKTPIERDLIKAGIKSIMLAPLLNKKEEVIGILEIGSPKAYGLHSFSELKFKEIVPLFSMAVERSREEVDNRIEAIIRERFTTIHPSVEWKFTESAFNLMERESEDGKKATPSPIVFDQVHPLYGQADIVGSSTTRNRAIQADFMNNLKKVKKVLERAIEKIDFPLLHQYLLETEHLLEDLKEELKSNDENRIMDFIKREIHELLMEISDKDQEIAFAVTKYLGELDEDYGVVYDERKKYEESVAIINETISDFLEQEDARTQKMIPHYFEKYKTDGVEYEIYAGQSILKGGNFSDIHLKNLRLWQLIAMCDITRKMDELRTTLPVPLSTAQLIFIYSNPISVRFRMDDKHFDVDGAYNIRYEIIKKRIDKAFIDGTTERLTQQGKIAIVYTADKDKNEYVEYLTYLTREGYIEDNIEDMTLGKLQGVQGLRALRVTVRV